MSAPEWWCVTLIEVMGRGRNVFFWTPDFSTGIVEGELQVPVARIVTSALVNHTGATRTRVSLFLSLHL